MGISKHGDTYLRTLLIHGARAAPENSWQWHGSAKAGLPAWRQEGQEPGRGL